MVKLKDNRLPKQGQRAPWTAPVVQVIRTGEAERFTQNTGDGTFTFS